MMQNSYRLSIINPMSMQIAILVFVTSFAAITGWLINRAPADHSADHTEKQPATPTSPPTGNEIIQESEPAVDEVIALSDTERSVRSILNNLVIPVVDLDKATLEEAIDFLRQQMQELDPQQRSFSCIIKHPQISSTDPLDPEVILPDRPPITIYEENISLTKSLHLICKEVNCRWEIAEHGIILTPLD